MTNNGVGARRGRMNTDYDAAQALLDLQSNKIPEGNASSCGWRDQDCKEDIEKAAKLILSCFISADVPAKNNPHSTTGNSNAHFPLTQKSLEDTSRNYRERVIEPNKISPRSHLRNSNKNTSLDRNEPHNNETYTKWPCSTEKKNYTRDIGTQTEEQYFNPNIQLMETTIQNLSDRIKSLETQIKKSLDQSVDEASFTPMERDLDYSRENNDQAPDFEMTIDNTDTANQSKYSRTLEVDSSVFNESCSRQTNKNVVYNGIFTNLNRNSYDLVPIGDGKATVPSRLLKHINWNSYSSATRKLLTAVFSRRILATHSLTGKPSPAFPNKPAKKRLDPALVNDIIKTVVERCRVPENVVRTSITTKCADESKMLRTREKNKKKRVNKKDLENFPPTTSDSDSDDN